LITTYLIEIIKQRSSLQKNRPSIVSMHVMQRFTLTELEPAKARHGRHTAPIRCAAQQPQTGGYRKNLPIAPPARAPPPPPPPPPDSEEEPRNELDTVDRRGLLAMLGLGTAFYWAILQRNVPIVAVDRKKNVALLRTKAGNIVGATLDKSGRIFMFDKVGNIYYDTGDSRMGIYIVDIDGNMLNEFQDARGNIQRVPVGNIREIQTIKVDEIAGVDLADMVQQFKELRSGEITGFNKMPDPDNLKWTDLMPPNAPAGRNREGRFGPPPVLEEGEIVLSPKKKGWFGGGGDRGNKKRFNPLEEALKLRRDD
jgi:hypothetical protein